MLIEEYIAQYLSQQLEQPVSGTVPHPMPESFVTVERTGGRNENLIRSATLVVQCWAQSMDAAANLCEAVTTAMEAANALPEISRCSLNSSYNFTDTSTKRFRYQAVFDLVYFL